MKKLLINFCIYRELRLEQTKLNSTVSDLNAVVAKIRTCDSLQDPEQQTDVLALVYNFLRVHHKDTYLILALPPLF